MTAPMLKRPPMMGLKASSISALPTAPLIPLFGRPGNLLVNVIMPFAHTIPK